MDEILIEEKKYVSSKQAAKITGYAKDYIGQLCREGRVPARLVGRSWYALESAIRDHRFGNPDAEPKVEGTVVQSTTKTWEFPRYQAVSPEVLPSLNRLEDKNKRAVIASEDNQEIETAPEPPQDLHDSWRVWFDHAAEKPTVEDAPTINSDRVEEDQKEREEVLGLQMEEDEITVPLRVVSHYASNAESFVSDAVQQEQPGYLDGSKQHIGNKFLFSIQLAMIFLSTVVLVLALIGSGYLDTYLVSNIQVESISGIRMFIK